MDRFGEFACGDCYMIFRSGDLLDKHQTRLCIGSVAGNPEASRRMMGNKIEPEKVAYRGLQARMIKAPDLISLREQKDKLMKHNKQETTSLVFSRFTEEVQKLRTSVEENLPRRFKAVPQGSCCGSQGLDGERLQENHEQKLAEIRTHATQLEVQRQEIERRLAGLNGHREKAQLEESMQELEGREERNEEVLHHLVDQIDGRQGVKEVEVCPDPVDEKKSRRVSCVDGPQISSQIGSLRRAYLQDGGCDPDVLEHLHDLQAEALALEQVEPEHGPRHRRVRGSLSSLDSDIAAVEHENLLLEEEILRMQMARERNRGRYAGPDVVQRNHVHQISRLHEEISGLRRELERSRARRSHPCTHDDQQTLMGGRGLDSLDAVGPAPYDPVSGFVIFYDVVLGVDAMFSTIFLVARLFTDGQEVGSPVPLPPVECQPAENFALVAVRQPVPGVPPSPSLSLVVEVQAVGGVESSNQEIRGWTKLQLFDQSNQVQRGFWKLPVRSLPVEGSLNPEQLSCLPRLCKLELCVRLVNARDEDLQSLITVHPSSSSSYYGYPPGMPDAPSNLLRSSVPQNQRTDRSPAQRGQDGR